MSVLQPSHEDRDNNETITNIDHVSVSVVFDHAQRHHDCRSHDRHAAHRH